MDWIGLILSVVLGFAPMFVLAAMMYWLDRYEKEPKLLLGGSFVWGAIIAVIGALILQLMLGAGVMALTGSVAAEEITQAEHRGLGIRQGGLQRGRIIGARHHHPIRMRFQLGYAARAGGGQRELHTALRLHVLRQGQADVAAAHDRDPHRRPARFGRG